jgi:hypothetical protein
LELIGSHRLSTDDLATRLGIQSGSVRTMLAKNRDRFTRDKNGLIVLNSDWTNANEQSTDLPWDAADDGSEDELPE